jgi:hypothetical protein
MKLYLADRLFDSSTWVAPILIAWEWWHSIARRRWTASLIVATISCLWLLLALAWSGAIGPDYSYAHGWILLANLIASLLTAIASVVIRSQRSLRVVLAALMLSFVWFFALAIMYAV